MALIEGFIYHIVARRGLAAGVPTLIAGEIGYDTDKKVLRVGDDTATPPRIPTDKSIGTFDFSSMTSWVLPGGVPVAGGKVDGVDISTLNQSNGILVRTADGTFASRSIGSGDDTLQVTYGNGVQGNIDIRIHPDILAALSAGIEDGDKGEITVTSGVWTIDAGAVVASKIASGAVTDAKIATPKWDRLDVEGFVDFTTAEPTRSVGTAGKSYINTVAGVGSISGDTFLLNGIYTVNAAGTAWTLRPADPGTIIVRSKDNEALYKKKDDGAWANILYGATGDIPITGDAYQLFMRDAGSTGLMAGKAIHMLTSELNPAANDYFLMGKNADGAPRKVLYSTATEGMEHLYAHAYSRPLFTAANTFDLIATPSAMPGSLGVVGGSPVTLGDKFIRNLGIYIEYSNTNYYSVRLEVSTDNGTTWDLVSVFTQLPSYPVVLLYMSWISAGPSWISSGGGISNDLFHPVAAMHHMSAAAVPSIKTRGVMSMHQSDGRPLFPVDEIDAAVGAAGRRYADMTTVKVRLVQTAATPTGTINKLTFYWD